jgi:AraC-like DNA-binding protein
MLSLPLSASELTRGSHATPIAFIRAIAQAYQLRGLDASAALQAAHIPAEWLDDAQRRVTAAQLEALSHYAMQELDDEALGWFDRRLPWGSYGMLARASLTAPTLGVALKRWCRHHALLTDSVRLQLIVSDEQAHICIPQLHIRHIELREFAVVSLLRNILGYACWLIDSRIPLLQTTLPFPAPAHAEAYAHLFPGEVLFDAPSARLSFNAAYLALAPCRDEAAQQSMLQRALALTVRHYRRDRLLVHSVRQELRRSSGHALSAEQLADRLGISVRSLHRHLHQEGFALQQIKDEVRRDHALQLLRQSRKPIKQIATAVGFDNEKSFARAFRGWTGMPPSAWRQQQAAPQ